MYDIKKFAKICGVKSRLLRYYDEIGILYCSTKKPNGTRMYSPNQVFDLSEILFLKELGMTLKQIKKFLTKNRKEKSLFFQERLADVEKKINDLQNIKEIIFLTQRYHMDLDAQQDGLKRAENMIKDFEKVLGKKFSENTNAMVSRFSDEELFQFGQKALKLVNELVKIMNDGIPPEDPIAQEAFSKTHMLNKNFGACDEEISSNSDKLMANEETKKYYEILSPGFSDYFDKCQKKFFSK